jgi:ADP-heptose:LPS heptosyltransferase
MNLRLLLIIDYYIGSFLHILLKPFVILLGKILRREHDLKKCRTVTVIKMLGGGSLTVAYPALVAIKNAPTVQRLHLLTTPAVKPFGEALGIFDDIIVIRINSPLQLFTDSLIAVRKLFLCDAIVDLEIHSRLTTVLALGTCARNRVGFYTRDSFWRKNLSTHLLFCNIKSGIYNFYDQVAALFGSQVQSFATYQETFRRFIGAPDSQSDDETLKIAISPCASDLLTERMLQLEEWILILGRRIQRTTKGQKVAVALFGEAGDRARLNEMANAMEKAFPGVSVENRAGRTILIESVREISHMDELICIDSALMHFSRLMGLPTASFWGPTDPESLLRPWPGGREEVHYSKLPCSPCVHLTDFAPCLGNNICMRLAVNPELPLKRNPAWIVPDDAVTRFRRPSAP